MPLRELPHGDFEVYAKSKWNFALKMNNDKNFIFIKD